MKKIIAVLLATIFILGTLTACGNTAGALEVTKGEFYEMVIKRFNYYPLNYTEEEMAEAENYDIEAQTMVDWALLPEEIAFKNVDKKITREEAALICLNCLYIKNSGNIDDIKDAKLCDYPQEMADAVANGIIILDNGYIDGNQKIGYEECTRMLNATMTAMIENEYEEGTGTFKYSDNCTVIEAEDLEGLDENEFIVEGYEEADEAVNGPYTETEEVDFSEETVSAVGLSLNNDNLDVTPVASNKKTFWVFVSKDFYDVHFSKTKPGEIIVYTGFIPKTEGFNSQVTVKPKIQSFAGKLVEVTENKLPSTTYAKPNVTVGLKLESIKDEEKVANTEFTGETRKISVKFEQIEKKIGSYNIEITNVDGGVNCKLTKQLHIKQNKYGNWRDAQANPVVTFEASITDMCLQTDNLQNFFKTGNNNALLQFTSKTTEKITLESGGLRLTPDCNRNGKFWSNLTSSRFTANNAPGAKSIKVAKGSVPIPNTPLTVNVAVYLNIAMDGKISFTFTQDGNGFKLEKKNGNVSLCRVGNDSMNTEINVNASAELKANISLNFKLVKKDIISGYIAGKVNVLALMSLYYEEGGEKVPESTGYGDPQEATQAYLEDNKIFFCVDVTVDISLSGGLYDDSLVGDIADEFGYQLSKCKFEFTPSEDSFIQMPQFHFHFENGSFVDECTLDHTKNAENTSSADDKFVLSQTKLHIDENMCGIVRVVDSPISDKKLKKEKGIKVKSRNEKICKVFFDEATKTIAVEAVGPGSTEVEVYVKKNKKSKKKYTQTFSVTVSESGATTVTPTSDKYYISTPLMQYV